MQTAETIRVEDNSHDVAYQWVKDITGLVSPPDVCIRLLDLVDSPKSTAHEIGEVISSDPNLSARLLKLVNSSFYNYSGRIETLSRAIAIVGTRSLYSLVISVSAVRAFTKIPAQLINMDSFWRHSLFCGIIARYLAKRCGILHPERLFVAGLLHDIGELVLFARAPERSRDLMLAAGGDENVLAHAERQEFGFSHADLGGLLATLWQLPETLVESITYHHTPFDAVCSKQQAAIVKLADILADRSELGALFESQPRQGASLEIDNSLWRVTGLCAANFDESQIIGDAGQQFIETVGVLFPDADNSINTDNQEQRF
ncbi:MAG: HDOD domain-containing protein [Gammaproteobacteria bacterium]|jgi:putative nucleotidyltransferase with HDIG domain